MMSNPPSSLQNRQRLHRRQNSTPVVAFEAMKVTTNTNSMPPQQRINHHRRGQSFDQQQQQQRSPIRRQHQQHGSMVSMTNLGSIHGQQILREAQQQKIARPGQQQQQHNHHHHHHHHHQQQLNLSMDMPISPDCGMYSASSGSMPETPFENMAMNAFMHHQNAQSMDFAHSQQQFYANMNMPMQTGVGLMDENNPPYLHDVHGALSQHSSGMSYDGRRMSQPDLRVQTQLRPHTPSHQIQTAQFPLTPPFSQHTPVVQYSRSLQASPALQSPYPVPMARGRSLQGIIENEEYKNDFFAGASRASFEMVEMPVPGSRSRLQTPPMKHELDPTKVKKESSPGAHGAGLCDDDDESHLSNLGGKPVPILSSGGPEAGSTSPGRLALSPRRMSISDLNLDPGIEASIEETNVTLDDIAQFIEGPDPADNKWVCKFEGCGKKFGRKENIKSHVQTHLGDRQFRCDHCKKCFVRGHDLKRHAKIHTGTKPYPCLCGNSFARHDALTRHRQRGMCIGAFDGVVKKVIKRGRPRKHRPEMEDRLDKANRTRQKTSESHDHYTSSGSSCSMSSWGSPPTENMDNLSIRGTSPGDFEGMALFGMPQHGTMSMDPATMGFPPDTFTFTPPASPGYSTGNKPSPCYRELTPADLGDIPDLQQHHPHHNGEHLLPELPVLTNNPELQLMNAVNGYSAHSLPSLSHSSSSPAADVVAFDFSDMPNPTESSSMTMNSRASLQAVPMKLDPDSRNEFDTFIDYGGMEMGLDASTQDFFSF